MSQIDVFPPSSFSSLNHFENLEKILLDFTQEVTAGDEFGLIEKQFGQSLMNHFVNNKTSVKVKKRRYPRSRYSKHEDGAPMILVPETTDRECIKSNALSSIGFMAFMVSVINAVMQVANNINNNNNNRNNNDNDNNQNSNNVNVANLGSLQTNMNMVMVGRRRRRRDIERDRLRFLRQNSSNSTNDRCARADNESDQKLTYEVALLGLSYIDLWLRSLNEEQPECLARSLCHHSSQWKKFKSGKRLLTQIGDVMRQGAAFYLMNSKDVSLQFIESAVEWGQNGLDCDEIFNQCIE